MKERDPSMDACQWSGLQCCTNDAGHLAPGRLGLFATPIGWFPDWRVGWSEE